ncbi:erythropoietin [Spea bombifrons]|uniref:erythropoietin n=1 Tax=Spea bombifrons TaxID=233779 RepID=UPI0023492084|nr:erythropoietin [Spea bombifrons]
MGVTGFFILLLMLFVKVRLSMSAPNQRICDNRVLAKYIREANEEEKTLESCNVQCEFPEDITVPETKLNQAEWSKLHTPKKASEVWNGLTLLTEAVPKILGGILDSKLKQTVERSAVNMRNLITILKNHDLQTETQVPESDVKTVTIRNLKRFFSVYINFLRGKYKLLLNEVCKQYM